MTPEDIGVILARALSDRDGVWGPSNPGVSPEALDYLAAMAGGTPAGP